MKHLFCWILVLGWSIAARAQNAQNLTEATRFIKVGNTLRMVDRPQQAIDLLLRALPAVQQKDAYLEAVAYENLGYAYNEQENTQDAVRYFQKALSLYQKLNFAASEAAMRQLIGETSGKNLYAGIDIGSSGVKLAIFRTTYENGFYTKDIKSKPISPNVTLVSGTAQSFKAGETVMRAYMDSIRNYNVPAERIYIAFSSGVNESMDRIPEKKRKLYDILAPVLVSKTYPSGTLSIDTTLSAAREAELFMIGAVPRKFWTSSSCIDIGSGNTKGGYYDANRKFRAVSFPYGTKTLANLIDNKQSLNIKDYKEAAARSIKIIADTIVNVEFNTASPGLQQRKTVAFGGGIAWAMMAYLHPDKATTAAAPITLGDVERFRYLAMNSYQTLVRPDLTNINDPVTRGKAESDLVNVQNQFNEKQIIAGALLLETIVRAYANTSVPKRFVFIRDSDIGWVTGKFLESLNQNFEKAIARGAQ